MLDNALRGVKEQLLLPAAWAVGRALHPNIITLIAFVWGIMAALFLAWQWYMWGLAFWLLNRFFDGLDGTVARENNLQTDFGGYFDILTDFVIYALVPITLVYAAPSEAAYLSLAFLLGVFYINSASWMYLSAILEKRARGATATGEMTSVTMPSGIIGGAETIVFYCAFILLPQYIVPLFVLMGLLVMVTIGQRLVWAMKTLD